MHTALVAAGLSVILASAPLVFRGIAVAGALYLGWLGIQGFRAPILSLNGNASTKSTSPGAAWRHGFFSNLLNPKVMLLYFALLPSFVAPELGATTWQLAILGVTIIVINIFWQGFLVASAGWMRRWLQSQPVQRTVSRATGVILFAFAIAMVWGNVGR